ncbi:Uncharacterized protein FF38_08264, partial [Lucilia cuprina]
LLELEQRVIEAEERAEEAEDKVRAMEQRLSEWPKPPPTTANTNNSSSNHQGPQQQQQSTQQQQQAQQQTPANSTTLTASQQQLSSSLPDAEKTINSLEYQVEEQRQLRLQDAKQIEAKAAKIKEWVNNKLRDLEEQNQLLREQNQKCNQQLELLKNYIANQSNRHSVIGPVRNSLSLDVQDFAASKENRRRSESLDTQEIINRPLTASYPHHQHRRNLSMEPTELERNLVAAVDGLQLAPLASISKQAASVKNGRPDSSDTDTAHDYAEIYTPSCEKMPAWMKNNPALMASGGNSSTTTTTSEMGGVPRPPTPPLHRFPSWEAKIYQVANDGLAGASENGGTLDRHSQPPPPPPDIQESTTSAANSHSNTLNNTGGHQGRHTPASLNEGTTTPLTPQLPTRQQQTASGGFCDISVPVYATVKGRASQIRSMPFTGDSSDDSSDGEDHAVMLTHNSHNSSSTDNTETSTSGSASSPSKSCKTSSSLSPAKRSGSESPKNTKPRDCVIWRHPILLHTKDTISAPLTTLHTEPMHPEAIKLFKSIQLFMSVAVNQPGIDYHVVLAQNALQHCLDMPELQSEMICILIKQTSRHTGQKLSVGVQVNKKLGKQTRQLLLCATQSLFACDTQQSGNAQANGSSPTSLQAPVPPPIIDCKSNPPAYSFVQGWQLLSLAVSLFIPKSSRLLWYLKLHLSRNADSKTETGKYAAYCERALERTLKNGGRETKPSRMEVLSILLKNPYHHSLPHAIPVHMMNTTYQVVSFDGSTTIEEFQSTLAQEIGTRDSSNGFCLFSDDPIEKDLEHYLDPLAKLCDVISKWETALREKGSGKFENTRVIQLTYKNRLYWKHTVKFETDKERLLLCYQTNNQIVQGRFPLSRDLALELASLMAQIDMGDYSHEKSKSATTNVGIKALDKFYPYRYRDALNPEQLKDIQELLITKWILLKGRSTLDCVRIYLTCCRKWPYFGASLFQAKPRHSDQAMAWLAVSEDALNVLELSSMAPIARYPYTSVMTFGGCQDDFMLVVSNEDTLASCGTQEQKLLFAMSKPKILEITLLIADYMNALGHTVPGTPHMNSLTRNGSHRSLRTRPAGGTGTNTVVGTLCGNTMAGMSTNATTTAHNTLNSHATHTLNSNHSHTLSSSHFSTGEHERMGTIGGGGGSRSQAGSHQGTMNSMHSQSHHIHHPHQPDILKSTPDHQRIK